MITDKSSRGPVTYNDLLATMYSDSTEMELEDGGRSWRCTNLRRFRSRRVELSHRHANFGAHSQYDSAIEVGIKNDPSVAHAVV